MAQERLSATEVEARERVVNWLEIQNSLDYSVKDFDQVKHLFDEDLRLAQQARSEIMEAEKTIRQARTHYRAGISADVTNAQMQLGDATRALSRQEYERAVELANAAEATAREAWKEAERRMLIRQRELEQRRREEQLRQMGRFLETVTHAAARAAVQMHRR